MKKKSFYFIIIVISILVISTPIYNIQVQEKGFFLKKPHISGSTAPIFSAFSPYTTADKTPDVSIHVLDSESGLDIGSEYFAFTTNGSEPKEFCNPHRDTFEDSSIAKFWSYKNQANGDFEESGTNISITDINEDHTWSGSTRNAPYLYQEISGDFVAQVKLSATLDEDLDVAGLLIRNKNDDFIRMQYIRAPFSGDRNIALRYSESGTDHLVTRYTMGPQPAVWLRIERIGDQFNGWYSTDGNNWDNSGGFSQTLIYSRTVEVGIFVGDQETATFDEWMITPWITTTGTSGTNENETLTVHSVNFNHYSDTDNKIKFKMSDLNSNEATSSTYTVKIVESSGPINFSEFQIINSEDKSPDVRISIQEEINGIDKDSASYAYSINGEDPNAFMNPYSDKFDDSNLQGFWGKTNEFNGLLNEDSNGLNFTDGGMHTWNESIKDAPCITQNIAGSFQVSVKLTPNELEQEKAAGGIIAILNSTDALKLMVENKSSSLNITFYHIHLNSKLLIGEMESSQYDPIWLRLIRSEDSWKGQYSTNGDTYANYITIGSKEITSWAGALTGQSGFDPIPNATAKVGLLVEHGASMLFEDWKPTPEISITGVDGSTAKESIKVDSVRFDQYSEFNNKIIFRVNNTIQEESISKIYTVNITTSALFRDDTLYSDGSHAYIIDRNKNVKWSYPCVASDVEMLPNGNVLLCLYGNFWTANAEIREVNITTDETVWSITEVDGAPLNWTHDVDWIGKDKSGEDIFLIADTMGNRVVEFYRNGTTIWAWYAKDHYTWGDPVLEPGNDWTHLNDADRLPDGSTMISLRNFDKIIIVNSTETEELLWEYGTYGEHTYINHPHNPEYTPRGTILIADSENHRIIELNKTTKEIIWEYSPTGEEYLGWPRDADLLPNGNMLISDSASNGGKNRIWEINATTKEVLWYQDTSGANYDADRLDTVLPKINILNPKNKTYGSTLEIPITIECVDPWVDEVFYRIYDETDNKWVSANNITYTGPTKIFLENEKRYTLHAWGKDLVMEGGAYPTDRAIAQLEGNSIQFTVNLSSEYSTSKPYPGDTLYSTHGLHIVDPSGIEIWDHSFGDWFQTCDAEILPNGNYLYCYGQILGQKSYVFEMTPDREIVWNYTIYETEWQLIHDADKLPNGNVLIADTSQDRIIEVDVDHNIVWEWNCADHLPYEGSIPYDWTHLNDADRLPNGNTLITLRNFDTVVEVNPAGEIVWAYGPLIYDISEDPNNHTILWGPHNSDRLSNGNTMIADSRNHRIIEVNPAGEIVWELNTSHIDLLWPRDCDKLPNGNILITDSYNHRIIEVNSTYDIVWECNTTRDLPYEADRIDISAPILNIHSPVQNNTYSDSVMVNISCADLDLDTIWYAIWDNVSSEWVDLTSQGGYEKFQIYEDPPESWDLNDGVYTLFVWANDSGYPMLGCDQHINIREGQINFIIGYGLYIINPKPYQIFGNSTFEFKVVVSIEGTLNATWYSLGVGQKNITFEGTSDKINQTEWDKFGNGTVFITFYANDTLGNVIIKEIFVRKDIIPPKLFINSPKNASIWNSPPLINITALDPNFDSVWYEVNGVTISLTNNIAEPLNISVWNGLSEGSFQIRFFSNDSLENLNDTCIWTLIKDTEAPSLKVNTPTNASTFNLPPLINITAFDPNFDSVWYEVLGVTISLTNNIAEPFNISIWNSLEDGLFQIRFFSNDSSGNINDTCIWTLIKDTEAPSLKVNSPTNASIFNLPPLINITAFDPNFDSVWYEVDGVKIILTNNIAEPFNISIWNSLENGSFQIKFFSNDSLGNINDTCIWTLIKDTKAPSIIVNEPLAEISYNNPPIINLTISDPHLDTIWYTFDNGTTIFYCEDIDQIDEDVWNALSKGKLRLRFYANDTADNEAYEEVIIYKVINDKFIPSSGDDSDDKKSDKSKDTIQAPVILLIIVSACTVVVVTGLTIYLIKKKRLV
ncbi:MAG: DUF1349 domain-containing protein [Promethearchaeota archaeon]|nr:MAG: DUF1349 domain-containing protein [Candidatus Lokiarchaeota archaeon]